MMGLKTRAFKTYTHINLEDLIPQNDFYRQLETKLDLSFVRRLVANTYAPLGRPSIDPVVFFKLQLCRVASHPLHKRMRHRPHLFQWGMLASCLSA